MSDSPDRAAPQPLNAEEEPEWRRLAKQNWLMWKSPDVQRIWATLAVSRAQTTNIARETKVIYEQLQKVKAENERLAARVKETINLLRAVEDRLMWDRDHMREAGLNYGADGAGTTRGHVLRFLEQQERNRPERAEPTEYPKEEPRDGD